MQSTPAMSLTNSTQKAVPDVTRQSVRYGSFLTWDFSLPFEPWWVLWVVAIAGAWLLPTHFLPWQAFHSSLLMTLALLPAAYWIVLRRATPLPVHASFAIAIGATSIPALQYAGGLIGYAGDAWICGMYLFGFALALLVGARYEQLRPGELADTLFAAIGAAALLSTGLALYQWLRLSGLGLLVVPLPLTGWRPFANLGQSNNLATLLVWGVVALWWSYLSRRSRGWIAVLGCAFLMIGIVATRSRTAWLELVLLAVGTVWYRRPLDTRRYNWAIAGLAVFFVLMNLGWPALSHALYLDPARSLSEEMAPGLRPIAWRLFLDAIMQHPWFGWGWNQQSVAHYALALNYPALHVPFQSAHNLVLDLLVENGVLLGGLLSLALALWFIAKAWQVASAQGCLLLLALGALLVHALLEFPQNYAYFLLPAGLMMGMLDQQLPERRTWQLGRWAGGALLCIATVLVGWVTVDYSMAERGMEQVRFERARIVKSVNSPLHSRAPDLHMLTQLRELLRYLHLRGHAGMDAQQLDGMSRLVQRYPADVNLMVYAIAAGLNGRTAAASDALAHLCSMAEPERCTLALAYWHRMAASSPALAAVKLPSAPIDPRSH